MTDEQKKQVTRLRQEGCGYTAIAKRLDISRDTVKSFCRRNGLNGNVAEGKTQAEMKAGCRQCGKTLVQLAGMKPRVFCSDQCRIKWWREHPDQIKRRAVYTFSCACCGKVFTAYGNSKRKYCSHDCYIKDRFKGGGGHD